MSTLLMLLPFLVLNAHGFFPVSYQTGDSIPVRVSNVAPFHNPTEKYEYDHLPWPCKPRSKRAHLDNFRLGSMFNGERNRKSLYEIAFNSSVDSSVCDETSLDKQAVNAFIHAITNDYQYEMWVDDIPVFGRIGFSQVSDQIAHGKMYFLITHRHFNIKYNAQNQIICVNISSVLHHGSDYVEIQKDEAVSGVHFTYSVSYSFISAPYWRRFTFMPSGGSESSAQVEVHWLWILNSTFLVVLLAGLLSMVLLRTVKNDYAHYLAIEDESDDAGSEDSAGWKRIRFDVFRAPCNPYCFASIVGVGVQLLLISFVLLLLAAVGYFYCGNHGRIYVAAVFGYSLTAYCAGYVASAKAKQLCREKEKEEYDWARSCAYTLCLFAVPYLVVFSIVNSIAIYYESAVALPAETILTIIFLWAFVTFPLTAFGAFRGKKSSVSANEEYPCNVKRMPRVLPSDLPWYYNKWLSMLMVGFLQFMSIYVELHTIFNSVWGHQPYTLFGILFLTFLILLIVTSCLVILATYFELNVENYKWWWPSLMRGAACGLFIYAYSIYYWFYTSQMESNALQIAIYFGYTFIIAYATCLMLASLGHYAAKWFVKKIYSSGWYD